MDLAQAIQERHSVRAYTGQKIEEEKRQELDTLIRGCNEESGLHIQICYDDPDGFDSKMAHYGKFSNVNDYIILAGRPSENLEEKCGYYGERIVLEAQAMGLNTCWVGLTFNKRNGSPKGKRWRWSSPSATGRRRAYPIKNGRLIDLWPRKVRCRTGSEKGPRPPCWRPRLSTSRNLRWGSETGSR